MRLCKKPAPNRRTTAHAEPMRKCANGQMIGAMKRPRGVAMSMLEVKEINLTLKIAGNSAIQWFLCMAVNAEWPRKQV